MYDQPKRRIVAAFLIEPGLYGLRAKGDIRTPGREAIVPFDRSYAIECTAANVTTIVLRE
jgi:hypothetical protein